MLQVSGVLIWREGIVTGSIYACFLTTYRLNLGVGMSTHYVGSGEDRVCDSYSSCGSSEADIHL